MKWILVWCCAIGLTSCFLVEEYENSIHTGSEKDDNKQTETTLQTSLQDTITNYFSQRFKDNSYQPYTFGEVFVNKPEEIKELEQLKDLKSQLPHLVEHYGEKIDSVRIATDSAIAQKKKEIYDRNLYPVYDLSHIYTIKKDKQLEVHEIIAYCYPNRKVKDISVVFTTPLSEEQHQLFQHYIKQQPLVVSNDLDYQKEMNRSIYNRFNTALINEHSDSKKDLLLTTLSKVNFYLQNNGFDENMFTNLAIKEWVNTENTQLKKATEESKTRLKDILFTTEDGASKAVGFKRFVLVKGIDELGNEAKKAFYFEFDRNLVLKGVLPVEGDYQPYFE